MTAMKRHRTQRGVAAIEFAILVVPLLIMAFGMTELGRVVYYYNSMVSSTRAAARYLGTEPEGSGEEAARCIAVHGDPGCQGAVLIPGLTTDMVHISTQTGVDTGTGTIDLVRVTIEGFPFHSLVPMVVADMTFGAIGCTMRQEPPPA